MNATLVLKNVTIKLCFDSLSTKTYVVYDTIVVTRVFYFIIVIEIMSYVYIFGAISNVLLVFKSFIFIFNQFAYIS